MPRCGPRATISGGGCTRASTTTAMSHRPRAMEFRRILPWATSAATSSICGSCLGFTSHLPSVPGRLPAAFRPEEAFVQHEADWARERKPLYAMQAALCDRAAGALAPIRRDLAGQRRTFAPLLRYREGHLCRGDEEADRRSEQVEESRLRRSCRILAAPRRADGKVLTPSAREVQQEHEAKSARQTERVALGVQNNVGWTSESVREEWDGLGGPSYRSFFYNPESTRLLLRHYQIREVSVQPTRSWGALHWAAQSAR